MSEQHKETIDRFIEDIRKTCHAMILKKHYTESPIAMVREAITYMEEFYKEKKHEVSKEETQTGRFS